MEIGDTVASTKMPSDSHYAYVSGRITAIRNGWATVQATIVQSKWDAKPERHPTACACSVKVSDLVVV